MEEVKHVRMRCSRLYLCLERSRSGWEGRLELMGLKYWMSFDKCSDVPGLSLDGDSASHSEVWVMQ